MAVFCERTAADPGLLARPDVQKLTPYQSARRIMQAAGVTGEVWLNANESAEPMAPETKLFNRYPEPQPEAVVERYAAYAGVSPEQILVTRGGDEGIELLVRTFCRPGEDAVLQFPPTYGMYAVSAETNGAEVVNLVTSPDRGWLPESVSLMHRRAAQCVMRKCELEVALEDLDGVEAVYPSASNFLLVRFVDAARIFTALRDRGIILRDQSRQPTLENCIRITVGTKDENERLLTELEEILKEAA